MTSTHLTAPRPPSAVTPRRPGEPEPTLTGSPLVHRALRSGARLLADAVTGIAQGQPCPHERQRAIVSFSLTVLHEVGCHQARQDHAVLHEVLGRARRLLPSFARDPQDTARLLAPVLTELADLLDAQPAGEAEPTSPGAGLFPEGPTPGRLLFLLPWMADQCTPEERAELVRSAGPTLRLLLRLGEPRYTRRRDLVRG